MMVTPSELIEKKRKNQLPESMKREPRIVEYLNSKLHGTKSSSHGSQIPSIV